MKIYRKALIGMVALLAAAPLALTGCMERTERVEIQEREAPAGGTVVVPEGDSDVDVNVESQSQPAPQVIEKETRTDTTINNNTDTGESTVETREETTVR